MPVAGPFYFTLTAANVPFNAAVHNVMDFYIFSFNMVQAETEFASLEIEIKNPGVDGLLAPGQPLWCWFSWFDGASIIPLFRGRLQAIPTNLLLDVITLKFVARPDDYETQRVQIANEIRNYGPPFYDEIFIDESSQTDTDAVLEAIAGDWHTDRVTHVVSISDILAGEDGTITFASGEAFLDELDVQIGETPLQSIDVEANVPWKQHFEGHFPLGGWQWDGVGALGVGQSWPFPGDTFSGGYTCHSSSASGGAIAPESVSINISWHNEAKEHRNGDTMSINESFSGLPGGALTIDKYHITVGQPYYGTPAHTEIEAAGADVWAAGSVFTSMELGYGAGRDRTEKITLTVRSDLQEVLRSNLDEQKPEKISLSGNDVTAEFGTYFGFALANIYPSYFMTARGNLSVQYLILLGVARLKLAARIVTATWGTTFAKGVLLTLRKSAALFDQRLQHDQIVGKITAYKLEGNGDSGVFKGECTVGAAIGLGNALVETEGTPTYCNADYVDQPYQMYEGAVIAVGTGDIGYSPPIIIPNDDGLVYPLTKEQVVIRLEQHQNQIKPGSEEKPIRVVGGEAQGSLHEQSQLKKASDRQIEAAQRAAEELGKLSSWLEVELKSLEGQAFSTEAIVEVSNLVLPKQYDVTSP